MSDSVPSAHLAISSNVYYLPAPVAVAPTPAPMRCVPLSRVWWRVRFALAGIRLAFRPTPTPLFAEDDTFAMLQGRAELIDRRPRRPQPAQVIDFQTARARLRPA